MDWLTSFLISGVTPRQARTRLEATLPDVLDWSPATARGGYRHYKVAFTLLVTYTLIAVLAWLGGVATAYGTTLLFMLFVVVVVPTGIPALGRWLLVRRQAGIWLLHPAVVVHRNGAVSLVGAIGSRRQSRTFHLPTGLSIEPGWFLDGELLRLSTPDRGTIELALPVHSAHRLAAGLAVSRSA